MLQNINAELTVSQAAAEANVTAETVRRWIALNRLPARKIESGTYRIAARDLIVFLRRTPTVMG